MELQEVRERQWMPKIGAVIIALLWQALVFAALHLSYSAGRSDRSRTHDMAAMGTDMKVVFLEIPDSPGPSAQDRASGPVSTHRIVADYLPKSFTVDGSVGMKETPDVNLNFAEASGDVPIRCEVHIHQNVHGVVQAIDFGECNGSRQWQSKLLKAIEVAAHNIAPAGHPLTARVRTYVLESDSISSDKLSAQLSE